jgi:hypothetical protein
MSGGVRIAALFVETGGVYYGLPDVDPWVVAISFLPHLRNIDQLIAARAA